MNPIVSAYPKLQPISLFDQYATPIYSFGGGGTNYGGVPTYLSGSIFTGNVPQTISPANPLRKFLMLQNISGSYYLFYTVDGTTPTLFSPRLAIGESIIFSAGFIPQGPIMLLSLQPDERFVAYEG